MSGQSSRHTIPLCASRRGEHPGMASHSCTCRGGHHDTAFVFINSHVVQSMGSHRRPVVRGIFDEFRLPIHFLEALRHHDGARECIDAKIAATLTFATFFSGICAPSIATAMLMASLQVTGSLIYCAACEYNPECVKELRSLPLDHVPRHVFNDLLSFATADCLARYRAMQKTGTATFSNFVDLFMATGNVLRRSYDVVTQCLVEYPFSWLVVSGHPCTDWSTIGSQQRESGDTNAAFLCFCHVVLLTLPFCLICENVPGFPTSIYATVFKDVFEIDTLILCPSTFGIAATRARRFSILTRRTVCRLTKQMVYIPNALKRVRDQTHTCEAAYQVAQTQELNSELLVLGARDSSKANRLNHGEPVKVDT